MTNNKGKLSEKAKKIRAGMTRKTKIIICAVIALCLICAGIIVGVSSCGSNADKDGVHNGKAGDPNKIEQEKFEPLQPWELPDDEDITKEQRKAYKEAWDLGNDKYYSKAEIYDKLKKDYNKKTAEFVTERISNDYQHGALMVAINYKDNEGLSDKEIKKKLEKEHRFTEKEVNYAMENIDCPR